MSQFTALRQALAQGNPPQLGQWGQAPQDARQAAVLILLSDEPDPQVLLTERAGGLRSHAGQISFPGGGADPGETATQTALREAREEVGLDSSQVRVLGQLPSAWVPVSGYEVTPVVATWSRPVALTPTAPHEVAQVLGLSISQLSDPDARLTATRPDGYRGPAFVVADWFIWGMTAHLLDALLRIAGWERSWDRSRNAPVPDRFQRDQHRLTTKD